jgi:hypothetical protein
MSDAFTEFVESLRRVQTRKGGEYAWAAFLLTFPEEEELELAATHFADWLFQQQWGGASV